MSEKNVLVRQRLIELEKKHAKALKKLQRAEKYKQRRQTFHGFTVRDENISRSVTQNNSSFQLSEDTVSTDVRKSRSSSAQKKGVSKTVTFKETLDNDNQPQSDNRCKVEEQSGYNKPCRRKSILSDSCISQYKSECNETVSQCSGKSDNSFVAVDSDMVIPNSSLISSNNETSLNGNLASTDGKDYFQSQQGVDLQAVDSGLCGLEQDVVQVPTRVNECCSNTLPQENCCTNSLKKYNAKNVLNPSKETVCNNRTGSSSDHGSEDNSTSHTFSLDESKDKVTVNEIGGKSQKKVTSSLSILDESDNIPSGNQPWLRLFEEEFPRRSPRIRSMPNFRDQANVSQGNNITQPRKTKPIRTKQSRTKKDTPGRRNNNIKSSPIHKNHGHSPHGSLPEANTCGFVFPRPSLEQTKNGGPLAVVVDFSLPDKEFAKLKLTKIKGTLSVERASKDINTVVEKITEEHGTEVKGDTKLFNTKCNNEGVSIVEEKTVAENVSGLKDHATWRHEEMKDQTERTVKPSFMLEESLNFLATVPKCPSEQETKKDSTQLVSGHKLKQIEDLSPGGSLERNFTDKAKEHSSAVTQQCNSQSVGVWWSNSFEADHKQVDSHMHSITARHCEVCVFSEKESQNYMGVETCANHCNRSHCNFYNVSGSCTSSIDGVQQADSNEKLNKAYHNYCDRHSSWIKSQMLDNVGDGLSEENTPPEKSTVEINEEVKFPSQKRSNDLNSKGVSDCGNVVSGETTVKGMMTVPVKQQDVQGEVSLTQEKSSPPRYYNEPSLGDEATPHGKMREPLESSQLSQLMSPEESREFSPVLMTACLQHHTAGMSNRVLSVALSSYEPSAEKDTTFKPQDKRVILAVCLSHMVVIWTLVSGQQWTVLNKWTLPVDGEEEFVSVHFVPIKSHVVLLVGGNFHHGSGRILGYSEEGEYSLNLKNNDQKNRYSFSTMSLLHDAKDYKTGEDVEFVIGDKTSNKITLTKWTLDSFCLLVEQWQTFTPICSDTELSSLQSVHGSHCLLLGTTDDNLFLWNYITCQQLRKINLHSSGLGHLSCLNAFTDRGLLFLIMSSNPAAKGRNSDHTNSHVCSLYAVNPRTSKVICLESFTLPERVSIVSSNGQYIAAGDQDKNLVNLWNLTNSDQHATLQVFQDEVSSIGFHQDKPFMAFGSITGCVHLFSYC